MGQFQDRILYIRPLFIFCILVLRGWRCKQFLATYNFQRLGKNYNQSAWEIATTVWEIVTTVWEIATTVWQIVTSVWEIATNVWEIATTFWEIVPPGKIVSVEEYATC